MQVTEKSRDTFRELNQHKDAIINKLLACFTENELEQLRLSLQKMRKNLV
jgi:DNA-binding MarR family transcriptional regulator